VSRSNKIVSLRRLASLESDVDAIAKTALVLETSTDDKKLIKLGALITIDDIREEMMRNHAMLEADDKERLRVPMLSMNANKETQIEHLVKIRKAISEWKVYTPGRLKFSVLDDTRLQDRLTAELQLPFYRLTEATRIEDANLKMYRARPIVPPTELNATDSRSTGVYSGEVSELDHDRLQIDSFRVSRVPSSNQRTRDYRLFTLYFDIVLVCTHRSHPLLQRRVRIDIYTYPSDHFYLGDWCDNSYAGSCCSSGGVRRRRGFWTRAIMCSLLDKALAISTNVVLSFLSKKNNRLLVLHKFVVVSSNLLCTLAVCCDILGFLHLVSNNDDLFLCFLDAALVSAAASAVD
jgi:hypothetical protein